MSEKDNNEWKEVLNKFFVMLSCFVGFIVGNLMNFVSLYWTSKWGMAMRVIINLVLWPWLWIYIWNFLNKKHNEKEYNFLKKFWVLWILKFFTKFVYLLIAIALLFLLTITINYWFDRVNCEVEKETINYLSCIDWTKHNILNISRIFHD
jgi:hypothetical protein